jgi:methionine sulfoxide reductase catalytic subunit
LADPKQMPGLRSSVLRWPYTEGLRMDEAMHPLTLLVFGMYGEVCRTRTARRCDWSCPGSTVSRAPNRWCESASSRSSRSTAGKPRRRSEYGFYSNVNPEVDHPRWTQASERRLGEDGLFAKRRPTLMFNGYAEQVASLYTGMDLRKNY